LEQGVEMSPNEWLKMLDKSEGKTLDKKQGLKKERKSKLLSRENNQRSKDMTKKSLSGSASSPASSPTSNPLNYGSMQPLNQDSSLFDFMNDRSTGFGTDVASDPTANMGSGGTKTPSGGSEGSLGASSIAHVASQAGFEGDDLVKAIAVAMAESQGNPNARGDVDLQEPGEQSTGLWQIHHRPSRDAGNSARSIDANYDPLTNARNAFSIFKGQGWDAWSVTHGTPQTNANHYSQYLDQAEQAVAQMGVPGNVR